MMFVPLHAYSGYSFLSSALRMDEYLSSCKKFGYTHVAISDISTLQGAPEFFDKAKEQGLTPIIGEELEIDGIKFCFYVYNELGYESLLNLHYNDQLKTNKLDRLFKNTNGLNVVLDISQEVIQKAFEEKGSKEFAKYLEDITHNINNFYIGINDYGENRTYIERFRGFIKDYPYTCIAFPLIKYIKKEDALILEMLKHIQENSKMDIKELSGNYFLLNQKQIEHLYLDEEISSLNKFIENIEFNLDIKRGRMVHFDHDGNSTSEEYLDFVAKQGLEDKGIADEAHLSRINNELDVINSMGFADYFLIVQDYVKYAKEHDIPVGPGRGSASGSLVAHALDITVVDPLKYDLYFERFLNKSRVTMPDIDVDFSDIKRNEIVEYIREKYGKEHVSLIAVAQTIGAKQALRDIGRIYEYPERDIELLSKLIINRKATLRETYKTNSQFRELINSDKYYLEIVSLASKIEGFPRQRGIHPSGIVINKDPLNSVLPLYFDIEGNSVAEYDMISLEKQGFLKMDILSLRNLTIIEECLDMLAQQGINLNINDIPYDDPEAVALLAKGDTTGIFQLESKGMRQAIAELKPNKFEDIVALLALFRPGPMDSIKLFARRKQGKEKVIYPSKEIEEILGPTYGIIVYQEQIMQIANKMAGLSLSEADLLRRAISKKDASKMDHERDVFIEGAIKQGYDKKTVLATWELIQRFANYGFNKSHSLSYAVFSCRMAYLKLHYPKEFYCAILNNTGGESDSFFLSLIEAKRRGITISNPDINESEVRFVVHGDKIIYPINRIKGFFNEQAFSIIKERYEGGKFEDFFGFVARMKKHKFTTASLMKLIDAGALDSLDKSRHSLRINIQSALSYADMIADAEGRIVIDTSFFSKPQYRHVEDDLLENLNREYEALGLMLSASPLVRYKNELAKRDITLICDINQSTHKMYLAAVVKHIKIINTKKGDPMAFVSIYDESGETEITLFSKPYQLYGHLLKKDKVLLIRGKYDFAKNNFLVDELFEMEEDHNA